MKWEQSIRKNFGEMRLACASGKVHERRAKSWGVALGLKARTQGYNVLFKNAATLSAELCEVKGNCHLGKLERILFN